MSVEGCTCILCTNARTTERGEEKLSWPESANFELLINTLEYIRLHPAEFYMPAWIVSIPLSEDYMRESYTNSITGFTGLPLPHCGTVACFAGHLYMTAKPEDWKLTRYELDNSHRFEIGALEALGLDPWAGGMETVEGRLKTIFGMVDMKTYEELKGVLEENFTFPTPLPPVATKAELKRVRDRENARFRRAQKKFAAVLAKDNRDDQNGDE